MTKLANPVPDQVPAGESEHDGEPAGAYVPGEQIFLALSASVVPWLGHAYPAGQFVQNVEFSAENLPAGHAVQVALTPAPVLAP